MSSTHFFCLQTLSHNAPDRKCSIPVGAQLSVYKHSLWEDVETAGFYPLLSNLAKKRRLYSFVVIQSWKYNLSIGWY